MSLPKHSLLYQLWCGRHEDASILTNKGEVLQKLCTWPWQNLAQSGFTHVYLLACFDYQGDIRVTEEEDIDLGATHRLPSPFALSSHREIHPDLGTTDDLKTLIQTLHNHDLACLLDFIPNHTGLDHPWIKEHPDWYAKDDQGVRIQEFSGDVAKLNYDHPDVVKEMISILEHIASLGADGVRVDMAHLIPDSFWITCIKQLKATYPDFVLIAESYDTSPFDHTHQDRLLAAGFDAVYDAQWYKNCQKVSGGTYVDLAAHATYLSSLPSPQHIVTYSMNHDEHKAYPTDLEHAIETLHQLLPTTKLVYNGQLHGHSQRLMHHGFELLDHSMIEVHHIPDWFHNIQMVIQALEPTILEINSVQPGVITVTTSISLGSAIAIINLSREGVTPPDSVRFPGLLLHTENTEQILPGKAEIFIQETQSR